jgi:putative transposase
LDANKLRVDLIERICRLPDDHLADAFQALSLLGVPKFQLSASPKPLAAAKDWPHAPVHRLSEQGTYMVTTGTYRKFHIFNDIQRLDLLESMLLNLAIKFDIQLEAWAVFSNHYHFIGHALTAGSNLKEFLRELHACTAREVNALDGEDGRVVWHNFWDKKLTFEQSYLARLNYVHQNAVKHGLVQVANQYRWCSAAWFERAARPAQVETIYGFKTDGVKVTDEFEPMAII